MMRLGWLTVMVPVALGASRHPLLMKGRDEIQRVMAEVHKTIEEVPCRGEASTRPRLGICVSGQMQRLALESKMRQFIEPNSDEYDIDIVFVLAGGAANFVNKGSDSGGHGFWTKETIAESLKSHVENATYVIDDAPQWPTPYVEPEYVRIMDKDWVNHTIRTGAHVKQWFSNFRCWRHLSLRNRQIDGRCTRPYDVVVKLRDDTAFYQPMSLAATKHVWIGSVMTSNCYSWGGVNDKASVMAPRWMWAYLAGPIYLYYFDFASLQSKLHVGNPENVLKSALARYEVRLRTVDSDRFPFYTSRFKPASRHPCFSFFEMMMFPVQYCFPVSCGLRRILWDQRCEPDQSGFKGDLLYGGHCGYLRPY